MFAKWIPALVGIAALLSTGAAVSDPYRFSGIDRVVAIGDVHGAIDELRGVLVGTGLIDGEDRWTGGATHLVSVGDLLDRGDRSREVMDLLMQLQPQAEAAGGRVHVVLGNHEVMNLTGELDYVTAGEFASYADFDPPDRAEDVAAGVLGHRQAFSAEGPYGQWLLTLPFAIVVNGDLYLHGGLSDPTDGLDLDELNRQAKAQLQQYMTARKRLLDAGIIHHGIAFDAARRAARSLLEPPAADTEPPDPALVEVARTFLTAGDGLPFHGRGPVWNRRNAVCHPYYDQQVVERELARLGAERLIIGHTPTRGRTIQSREQGRVVLIDTGMNVGYYSGHPAALVIENGGSQTVYTDLPLDEIVVQSNRSWDRPYGLSDAEIEAFLLTAEVVQIEDLPTGVTKPQRLTLRQGDRQMRAVFKTFDTDPGLERGRWNRLADKADRYQHDVAAYRLDRILGFELVPPAVIRSVEGREGLVQYWIEGAINERDRRAGDIPYLGECSPGDQYNMLNVFDVLIHNDDRNLTNVMYTKADWKVWSIDHSRAFRSSKRAPGYLKNESMTLSPQMREALEGLDASSLEPLKDLLHRKQIEGILGRARTLLKR